VSIKESDNVRRERLKAQLVGSILNNITNSNGRLVDDETQQIPCRKADTKAKQIPEALLCIEDTKYIVVSKFVIVLMRLDELGRFCNVSRYRRILHNRWDERPQTREGTRVDGERIGK